MARSIQMTYSNVDAGGRLQQSYDSKSEFYGDSIQAGRPRNVQDCSTRTAGNCAGSTRQVSSLTIGTLAVGSYSIGLAIGTDNYQALITVDAVVADTAATLEAKILDALKASRANSRLKFAAIGGGVITMTATNPGSNGGFDATLSGGGAGYSVVETTPPGNPTALAFGRLVVAVPADQQVADRNNPNGTGDVIFVRYARTAAELEYIAGVLLRSEFNSLNFFGAPSQEVAELPPGQYGTVLERGDVAVDAPAGFVAGTTFHVYLESAGPSRAGKIRSTADPAPGLTAPIPAAAYLKLKAMNPVAVDQPGYINIK